LNWGVFVSTFLAATIEVIEMVAIVVAIGVTRSWRASLLGAAGGLVVLGVLVGVLGVALQGVPLKPIRLVVGALLLVFGNQWLRKGIVRVSRDGWAAGIGEEEVDEDVSEGFDWTGFVLSFKGVSLEGLEVAVIVVAFGAASDAIGSAVFGAAASVVIVGALGLASYRWVARIPRRALQLFDDLALVWLGAFYVAVALTMVRAVSGWRRSGITRPSGDERPSMAGGSR
jgi:uncharacterized membrane protein